MTPNLPDILLGQSLALAAPQPPEASGDYMAGRLGMIALLCALAAQEAERGIAARLWENQALRDLFARAAGAYDEAMSGALAQADGDAAWSALDLANAELRRRLITLHEAVEARGDAVLDAEILTLYRAMAHARRLELPASMSG